MNHLIWLASYPKSGNTWFRIFLTQLLHEQDDQMDINGIKTDGIFSSRAVLDHLTGVETSDLTMAEIDRLRPKVYNHLAHQLQKNLFVKVHDAYTFLEDGQPLLGTVNAKAIYILRNPLDVAVSFSNHLGKGLEETVEKMGKSNFGLCQTKQTLSHQVRQKLLSWSEHVESWKQATELDVHFMRYEDMKLDSLKTFAEAVRFIGLDYTEEQIQAAIDRSDFSKLKEQEQKNGFVEKPHQSSAFFRKGEIGDWRNHLTEQQVARIISDHRDTMKHFGYLTEQDELVY